MKKFEVGQIVKYSPPGGCTGPGLTAIVTSVRTDSKNSKNKFNLGLFWLNNETLVNDYYSSGEFRLINKNPTKRQLDLALASKWLSTFDYFKILYKLGL